MAQRPPQAPPDAASVKPGSKHFVLVHGAWHGAWCWYKTATLLQADGHRVTVLDLPAHGIDPRPAATVTAALYAQHVVAVIDAIDEPVILVGHSMGGTVVSNVAEACPQRLEKLVYLAAFLLANGQSLFDIATGDSGSLATPSLIVKPEEGFIDIDRAAITAIFYGDCEPADINLARSVLRPTPFAPFVTPLTLGANYESVRRFYIECTEDHAITVATQRAMVAATPCEAVHTMHTDHSPFFSQPAKLHKILTEIAGT